MHASLYRKINLILLIILSACARAGQSGLPVIQQEGQTPGITQAGAVLDNTSALVPQNQQASPALDLTTAPPDLSETTVSPGITARVKTASPTNIPPDYWMSMPVIPTVSKTAQAIYQRGIEAGRDPHAFSKIGDCQSITTYFLKYFDLPGFYNLGSFTALQETIDWFAGSFSRQSLAVKGGFNAAAILSPLRADPKQCISNENPISCELRVHNPSITFISLEEWWAGHPENYEVYMRQILDYTIQQGVVPILATKADNLEGNNLINQTIARLAIEYDIPLWNFWRAVQPLPDHGLIIQNSAGEVDMFHLTHSGGYYFYDDPATAQSGWSMRNLTALQALDAVRRGLSMQP